MNFENSVNLINFCIISRLSLLNRMCACYMKNKMNMTEKERMYVKQQELQVGVHETDADGSTLGPVV